jgi:hypothetical protein
VLSSRLHFAGSCKKQRRFAFFIRYTLLDKQSKWLFESQSGVSESDDHLQLNK